MTLIRFQHNATVSTDIRTEQLDGKEWLVAPCVAIVEGVLNGLYVPSAEIEISTPSWNGRPIPVHHPKANTANEPITIQNQVIGYFYQSQFKNNSLHGEMWLDMAKANSLGGDALTVITTIQNGGMIEVSTAYWAYTTSQAGEFNGVPYTDITTHILPDHIAVLPGDEGACNINDGCGVPRKNQRSEQPMKMILFKCCNDDSITELEPLELDENRNATFHFNVEGVSHRETNQILKTAVNFVTDIANDYYIWVTDVWDSYFVYEIETNGDANGYWKRDYTIDENMTVTLGEATRVQPRRVFEEIAEPAPTVQTNLLDKITNIVKSVFRTHDKERNMKEKIKAIIENGAIDLTAEQLAELPETAVNAMFDGLQINDESEPEVEPVPATEPDTPSNEENVPAWAAALIAKVDGLSVAQNKANEQEKTAVIKRLLANGKNTFTEAELKAFELPQLQKFAAAIIEPDYTGLFYGQEQNNNEFEYSGLTINVKDGENNGK